MIVRLMGDGQFLVDDGLREQMNAIDEQAAAAVESGNEDELRARLEELSRIVEEKGERLEDGDLSASDLIVPPADLSLEEAHELFAGEGLIPDLPV
jgi:PspA-Associated protein